MYILQFRYCYSVHPVQYDITHCDTRFTMNKDQQPEQNFLYLCGEVVLYVDVTTCNIKMILYDDYYII